MGGMTAYLGIILGAVGIVFGVVALMISAEMTRRVTAILEARFQQAELELMKGLDGQDRELKRQRRVLAEAMESLEKQGKTANEYTDGLRMRICALEGQMEERRNVRRVAPSDDDRGFGRKRQKDEKFEVASPFAE